MKLGFSFSPGGLLLPYHLGVMDGLSYADVLSPSTPIAGSSAGAIATACHGCGIPSHIALQATIDISNQCKALGGATGRLIPLLREKMKEMIGVEELARFQSREGPVGVAYRELFPFNRPIVQTEFDSVESLTDAVIFSSTFPFFSDRWPVAVDTRSGRVPRVLVDGYFSVPRGRFGCPDFALMPDSNVERNVCVSILPQESIGLSAVSSKDCIAPAFEGGDHVQRLLKIAMEPSSAKELMISYENGLADAERWCREHRLAELETDEPFPIKMDMRLN